LKQFKKLLPALEKVVGPVHDDTEEGLDDLPPHDDMEDVGPTPGKPPMGGPPGGPGGPPPDGPRGLPPAARPPRRPGVPGGRPPGPPGGVSTFTKRKHQMLETEANISEVDARRGLEVQFPQYAIREFKRVGSKYVAHLQLKE